MITLYHYTNIEGRLGIANSGYIQQSGGGRDAAFGNGVYLTSIPPTASKVKIVANNWGSQQEQQLVQVVMGGKVDFAVEINIPINQVEKCRDSRGRDIYLYRGTIFLNNFTHRFVVVEGNT